jgi:hypothetical protein
MASRPKGRQGSLISDERGSLEPGTAVAYVLSSGDPLTVLCSSERKGCGSTQGQQELVTARVCREHHGSHVPEQHVRLCTCIN